MNDGPPAFSFWLRSLLCLTASACFFALLVAVAYNIRDGGDAIRLDGAIVRRSIRTGIVVVATVGLVGVGSTVGKLVITAAHPQYLEQMQVSLEHTFPSGHVASALTLMGIVAIACGGKPRHLIIWLGIAGVTAIVAATRIYLGAHWFSDTLGGVFLGCSAVFAGAALLSDRTGPRRARAVA